MQDWGWEVADVQRLDEFITAYQSGELDDDERFTLMEMILQSFENLGDATFTDMRWDLLRDILDMNIQLHADTVWYWARPGTDDPEQQFAITPVVRPIWDKHRAELSASD